LDLFVARCREVAPFSTDADAVLQVLDRFIAVVNGAAGVVALHCDDKLG
jgi:hypothetical protein